MNNFIKVCGITNLDDLELLTTLDVDAVGFNLYQKSKRFIDIHHVKKLVEKLPEKYLIVLIFVNHEKDFVSDCLKQIPNAIPQKMPRIKIILFLVPPFKVKYVKKAMAIVNRAKRNLKLINPQWGNILSHKAPNKSAKKTILFVWFSDRLSKKDI